MNKYPLNQLKRSVILREWNAFTHDINKIIHFAKLKKNPTLVERVCNSIELIIEIALRLLTIYFKIKQKKTKQIKTIVMVYLYCYNSIPQITLKIHTTYFVYYQKR